MTNEKFWTLIDMQQQHDEELEYISELLARNKDGSSIRFVKDNDHPSRTMCSVNVIPMPCSGRDSDVQKKLHNTPTNGLNDGWLFLIGTRMALSLEHMET